MKKEKKISIIVPIYNSNSIIPQLLTRIDQLHQTHFPLLEVVLIDDGSRDGSFETIKELCNHYHFIKGLRLVRNFGHQNALRIALENVSGDYIAIIDDDLQDPPELLVEFKNMLDQGHDVAYGVRRNRKESKLKVFAYKLFYRIFEKLSEVNIPLDAGEFSMMKKSVVENINLLKEKAPYLPGARAWVGGKQIGIEYDRETRHQGESGYTLSKLIKTSLDAIFSYSYVPIRFITFVGILGIIFSFSYGIYTIYDYFANGIDAKGFLSLAFLIMLFSSIHLLSLGILGEYISRMYSEGKNRPFAIVAEKCFGTDIKSKENFV